MSECNTKQEKLMERTKTLAEGLIKKSAELGEDIKEKAKGIDPNIDTGGMDVWVGADVDIKWERVDFSLDLPEIKMVDQEWSLDLPQVTMNNQDIIFHTPSVRMKTVKTGEYPEVTCRNVTKDVGLGIKLDVPECTVRWSPIYIDVPEPFMEEQKIVLSIPEFKIDTARFILGVPEFAMKMQKFSLDLPQITVKNIKAEAAKAKEKGTALSLESKGKAEMLKENFKANAKIDLGADVTALFDCYQKELMDRKNDAVKRFEDGINVLQATISAMSTNKVPDNNEALVKMKQSHENLLNQRDEFAKTIEQKFITLSEQQKNFFDKMLGGVAV